MIKFLIDEIKGVDSFGRGLECCIWTSLTWIEKNGYIDGNGVMYGVIIPWSVVQEIVESFEMWIKSTVSPIDFSSPEDQEIYFYGCPREEKRQMNLLLFLQQSGKL